MLVFTSNVLKPSKHTLCCNIKKLCILPTHCSYVLQIHLAKNIHFSLDKIDRAVILIEAFFYSGRYGPCNFNHGEELDWGLWVTKLCILLGGYQKVSAASIFMVVML